MKSLNIIDATVITKKPGFRFRPSYGKSDREDLYYPKFQQESERILKIEENANPRYLPISFSNPKWTIIYLRKKIAINTRD